jgi:hypothetical protein
MRQFLNSLLAWRNPARQLRFHGYLTINREVNPDKPIILAKRKLRCFEFTPDSVGPVKRIAPLDLIVGLEEGNHASLQALYCQLSGRKPGSLATSAAANFDIYHGGRLFGLLIRENEMPDNTGEVMHAGQSHQRWLIASHRKGMAYAKNLRF